MSLNLNKNSGAVLLTVIVLSMVLSFVVIAIMSSSVTQVKSSQGVIDDTKAEYLGQAYFYQYHQEMMNAETDTVLTSLNIPFDEPLGIKTFTTISEKTDDTINNTTKVIVNVSY